jgi:uncharacterized protein YdhG (YjbR/CyaY superfamily)
VNRRGGTPPTNPRGATGAGTTAIDAYIRRAPAAARGPLGQVRRAIRSVAPGAVERISYRMPGYADPGYDYRGMFAWFALQKGYIGLYVRPPTIADHRRELAGYRTTKSAVHLPLDRPVPVTLIRTLVRASRDAMRAGGR